jgi:hypothetical protein
VKRSIPAGFPSFSLWIFLFQAAAPQKEDVKKAIFGQKKNLLTPRGPIPKKTSSGGRRKKRFSASENHFCKPLPPKAPALREKNGFRQAKITFSSPYPFQGTSYGRRAPTWRKLEKRFWQTKITFPMVWPFQAPTLQIHPKE